MLTDQINEKNQRQQAEQAVQAINAALPPSKWRECSTVFKVNGRKSARNIGIDYPKPKKAAPQAEAWAPFL